MNTNAEQVAGKYEAVELRIPIAHRGLVAPRIMPIDWQTLEKDATDYDAEHNVYLHNIVSPYRLCCIR
jgi:hypothetical protein